MASRHKDINDERIVLADLENKGIYTARNLVLSIHCGKGILCLNADDDVSDITTGSISTPVVFC